MSEEGILSKLLEKKSVNTYVKARLAELEGNEDEIVEEVEPEKREAAIKQVKGRKKELRKLREIVNSKGLKEYAQENWGEVQKDSTIETLKSRTDTHEDISGVGEGGSRE